MVHFYKKWLQQAREYVLIWLQLIFQWTSVISYCDVLLNVTWDIESFVFEIMILNLICCNSDKWAENLMSFELKCCYDEWADCLSGLKFDGPLWWAEKFMGWNTRRQPPCHHNIPCQHHIIGYVSALSLAMSAPQHPLRTRQWPYQRPCHKTCGHCVMWPLNLWRLFSSQKMGLGWALGTRRYSMMVLKRHGSSNLWQKFKERHEVWSMTLNTWQYLRSS